MVFVTHNVSGGFVMKKPSPRRCAWCKRPFKPKPRGRPSLYCKPACRQRAYEKRKWSPFSASDALSLDLLPRAALRKLQAETRYQYMIDLIKSGVVLLTDPAQIDGLLDPKPPEDRRSLLRQIEDACRRRGDEIAMSTIARWRLQRQNR